MKENVLTRSSNLIFASAALLVFVGAELGWHSALSPSPARRVHPPLTVREIVIDSIVVFWFVGALGLSCRKRLSWVVSLVGVGASVCFFAVSLVGTIVLYMFPNAEMHHLRDIGGGGYIAALVIVLAEFSIVLGLLLALFIGLLKMRKELK